MMPAASSEALSQSAFCSRAVPNASSSPGRAHSKKPSVTITIVPPSDPITTLDLPITTASIGMVNCVCMIKITVDGSPVPRQMAHGKLLGLPVEKFVLASDGSDFTLT